MRGTIFFIILFLFFPLVKADVMSVNSGGSENIIINPGKYIEDFFSGIPAGPFCGDGICNADEDCSTCSADCACSAGYTCSAGTCVVAPSVSGGASGSAAVSPSFSLDKDLIHIIVKQGTSERETIEIKNTGGTKLDFEIDYSEIDNLLILSEFLFSLKSRESKIINADFFAKEFEIPDVYTGRIYVKGGGITKVINVIIEVKDRKPLFDIITKVRNKRVKPGKCVNADIRMINMGDLEHIDVILSYSIKDFEGNTITFTKENLAIEKELNVKRTSCTSKDFPIGEYIFYSKVGYDNITASSADSFKVVEVEGGYNFWVVVGIILLVVLAVVLRKKKKKKEIKKKEKKLPGAQEIINRIKKPSAEELVESVGRKKTAEELVRES